MKRRLAIGMITLTLIGCRTGVSLSRPSDPPLRHEFVRQARPSIRDLLADTEKRVGLRAAFVALPDDDPVLARCIFDQQRNEPRIMLRRGWQDVDVAHELMHVRMELMEGFSMLAWRRDVERTEAVEAAFGRVQTYVNDEVVHAHLAKLGLRVDGEIFRSMLFDSLYTHAAQYLEEGRDRPNDGMAHLDRVGHGPLCRAAFLMQAERLLLNYRARLPTRRIEQTERFIRTFRAHRPEEAAKADAILTLFREHDVMKPAGQREILRRWAELEKLDRFVGVSAYRRTPEGRFILPYPP